MATNPDVVAWMEAYDNPQKPVVQAVRELILGSDKRITECIKWKSPTFVYEGNIASFNPRSKQHASLMFHTGAKIPGKHSVLEGGGETARYIKFADLDDVKKKSKKLQAVLRAWCKDKDK